jgi:hypothetical protein
LNAAFCASHCLGHAEEEGEVAMDAFFLQDFSGFDAFPGGGDLDQHALAIRASSFVEADDLAGLVEGGLGVKGETSVHFGADAAWDDLEDLLAKVNEDAVDHGIHQSIAGEAAALHVGHAFVDEAAILGLLCSSQNQRGVGGGVLGLVSLHGLEVACVCDYHGVLLQLIKLAGHNGYLRVCCRICG